MLSTVKSATTTAASVASGLVLAYALTQTRQQLGQNSWSAALIGVARNSNVVDGVGIAVLASLGWLFWRVLSEGTSVQMLYACTATLVCLVGLTLYRSQGNSPDFSNCLCALSSIGLGLILACTAGRGLAWTLTLAGAIVAVCALFLYSNGANVLQIGRIARASGGADIVVITSGALGLLLPAAFDRMLNSKPGWARFAAVSAACSMAITIPLTGSWAAALAGSVGCAAAYLSNTRKEHSAVVWVAIAVLTISTVLIRVADPSAVASNAASKVGRLVLLRESALRVTGSWPSGQGFEPPTLDILNPVSQHASASLDPHCEPVFALEQFGLLAPPIGIWLVWSAVAVLSRSRSDLRSMLVGTCCAFAVYSLFESTLFMLLRYGLMVIFGATLGGLLLCASQPRLHLSGASHAAQ